MEHNDNADALNTLVGRCVVEWHRGDNGYHFLLDDGRMLVIVGVMGILLPEEHVIH